MKNLLKRVLIFIVAFLLLIPYFSQAQRKMEKLGRGVVAIRTATANAFISWRLLGTEPQNIGFNIYRSTNGGTPVQLNNSMLVKGTNYTDHSLNYSVDNSYFVKPVIGGVEQEASAAYTLTANHAIEPCVVVPLKKGSLIHLVSVGDLDGDGEYDYVIDRVDDVSASEKIEAYKRDGTYLWTIDLGSGLNLNNISPGPTVIDVGNWDGVTVYDMDGDGKAEVLLKTASGVTFGDGKKLTYSNPNVQFISVINGMTGAERARTEVPNNYLSVGPMGCSLGIGYLNGQTPSLVGFFKNRNPDRSFNRLMCAWDFDGTNLTRKWATNLGFGASYSAHGADGHQMRIYDCNGDGKDDIGEVAFMVNGEDGSLIYDLGYQGIIHGDRWFAGKLDPDRPGLQGYGIQQDQADGLIEYYYDAGTGEVLWKHSGTDIVDVGRGETGDIDPRYPGYEVWSFSGQYNGPTNTKVANSNPYPNFRIWWDGDILSENLNDSKIEKWNYQSASVSRLLTAWHYHSATGSSRAAPLFYGDIMGDWREEVIYANSDYSQLVIFTTPDPTDIRLYTLAQDPEYRNCMTVKGYMQSHMVDYYLGAGMTAPPTPPIQTAKSIWKGNASNNVWDSSTSNWTVNGTAGTFTKGDDVLFDIAGDPDTAVVLNESVEPSSVKVITSLNYSFNGTGTITGSTGILKSGHGTLTFNCPMSYTDTTRLEEGALFINNELSQSPVLVYHGTKLGGNGTIAQPVKLIQGASISPGKEDSTGTLTFSKDLILPSNCTVYYDITSDSTGTQKPSDKMVVKGDLTIADAMTIVINKIDSEVKPGNYPLITYSGSFTGDLSNITVSGLTNQKYNLTSNNGMLALTVVASRAAASVTWNGTKDTWDLQTTTGWSLNQSAVTFVAGDTVTFDDSGSENTKVNLEGTLPVAKLVVNSASNYTLNGNGSITGNGSLVKDGIGKFSLLTMNDFTGTTTVNGGSLEINSLADAGEKSSIGANTSVDPSAFTLSNAKLIFTGEPFNNRTNKGLMIGGAADTIEVPNSSSLMAIKGLVTGSAKLVKTGNGTLHLLNNANVFTGGTVIKKGTIQLNDPGSGQNVAALGTGLITFEGGTLRTGNTRDYTDFNANIEVPANQTGTFIADQRCNYGGKLTGSGILNLVLPGSIDRTVFRGDWSAFSGTINVSGVAPMRLASNSGYNQINFDLSAGMGMYFSGGTGSGDNIAQIVHLGSLNGEKDSYLTGENWSIGENNQDGIFAGKIYGNSLTKLGTGSLLLTDTCFYSSSTILNSGTLKLGSFAHISGPVSVNDKAILSGNGSISGTTSINRGGSLSPGITNIGTLTFGADLNLKTGSIIYMKVDLASHTNDKVKVGATINYNGILFLQRVGGRYSEGDQLKLFDASNYHGELQSIIPSTPGDGLAWDTTKLNTQGILLVDKATGVDDNITTSFNQVFPNPFKNELFIQTSESLHNPQIKLFNLEGKEIQINLIQMSRNRWSINTSHLQNGQYVVYYLDEKMIKQSKVIVKVK